MHCHENSPQNFVQGINRRCGKFIECLALINYQFVMALYVDLLLHHQLDTLCAFRRINVIQYRLYACHMITFGTWRCYTITCNNFPVQLPCSKYIPPRGSQAKRNNSRISTSDKPSDEAFSRQQVFLGTEISAQWAIAVDYKMRIELWCMFYVNMRHGSFSNPCAFSVIKENVP